MGSAAVGSHVTLKTKFNKMGHVIARRARTLSASHDSRPARHLASADGRHWLSPLVLPHPGPDSTVVPVEPVEAGLVPDHEVREETVHVRAWARRSRGGRTESLAAAARAAPACRGVGRRVVGSQRTARKQKAPAKRRAAATRSSARGRRAPREAVEAPREARVVLFGGEGGVAHLHSPLRRSGRVAEVARAAPAACSFAGASGCTATHQVRHMRGGDGRARWAVICWGPCVGSTRCARRTRTFIVRRLPTMMVLPPAATAR